LIASSIPGRTVRSCRARWFRAILPSLDDQKKRQRPGTWTEEQDIQLEELVMKYGRNWKKVSFEMQNRTPDACDIRWYGVICKRKRMNGDPIVDLNMFAKMLNILYLLSLQIDADGQLRRKHCYGSWWRHMAHRRELGQSLQMLWIELVPHAKDTFIQLVVRGGPHQHL